jgi:glycosyltransferase involved in cell wall biosynthesis
MNICLVSREYPSDDHAGGIGTYTEKTARGLAAMGQRVTVITEAVDEPSTQVEDGVTVHRLRRAEESRLGRLPHARTLARSRAVADAIIRLPEHPDVVQACEHGAEGFWYSLHDHRPAKLVTRLATPISIVAELSPNAGLNTFKVACLDWLERTQTRRSDAVFAMTNALADAVAGRWRIARDRISIVPTGVDFAARVAPHAAPLPAELIGVDFLLYFGRLEERKGVHVLAEALPAVLGRYPDLHVVFAGNNFLSYRGGTMREFVEHRNAAYRDRLHFYPRLPQRELHPLLQAAVAVVLPSLWEAMANATLEAQDMGKPVVATAGCGFGEVIEDGQTGLLVPPGDAAALTRAIEFLLADRRRLAAMSKAARERAQQFTLERAVAEQLAFYQRLLGTPVGVAA